jgi:hypothetical protein
MKLKYHNEDFSFVSKESDEYGIKGFLILSEEQKNRIAQLEEAEDENWYLDDEGERLGSKALFSASPWSISGPSGEIKLLCRFRDNKSGEIWLNTEEGYLGELFK